MPPPHPPTLPCSVQHQAQEEGAGWGRKLKIGLAAVGGGAALALTGGLAAPAVASVAGAVGLTGVAGGGTVMMLSASFGAAGAGLVRAAGGVGGSATWAGTLAIRNM